MVEIQTEQLRPLQIIHFALAGGVFVFLVVTMFLPGSPVVLRPGGEDILTILSMVHVIGFFSAFAIGRFVYDSQLRHDRLQSMVQGLPEQAARDQVLGLLRRVTIVRLALLEGAAFFGLAVVLIAKMTGVVTEAPVYWLNALSSVIFIGFVMFTFPTRDKINDLLR
jgi:hypothetical protein